MSETGGGPAADPSPKVEPPGTRAATRASAATSAGRRPRIVRAGTANTAAASATAVAASAAAVAVDSEVPPRRRIPWWWYVVGLIALALVGRGVVGAATDHRAAAPSAARVATPAPTAATGKADPAPTAPSPTDTLAATPPTVAATTPPRATRVILPRAGATTTPSSTSAEPSHSSRPSPSHPAPTPVCAVSVDLAPFWGGYNATVTIRNTGTALVNGWQLSFMIPDQQHLASGWSASLTGGINGGVVLARDAGYNAVIVPAGTTQFGLQVTVVGGGPGPSVWQAPYGFALNGGACS